MQERIPKLEALLKQARTDQAPFGVNIGIPSPAVVEITGRFGFDYLIIDQEHTVLGDNTQLSDMARAADLTGRPWFVKVPKPEHLRVRDAMDAGAWGVMLPHIRTAAQLQELMHEILLPPLGRRGVCSLSRSTWHIGRTKYAGGRRPMIEFRDYINQHMCIIPTIESVEGLQNLDAILEVPGYQIIHLGVEDIWMSLTHGNDMPKAKAAADAAAKRIREAGKIVMTFCEVDDDHDRTPGSMVYTAEVWCMAHGIQHALKLHGPRNDR